MKYIFKALNRILPLTFLLLFPIVILMIVVSNLATLIWHFKFYWHKDFSSMINDFKSVLLFKVRLWKPINPNK